MKAILEFTLPEESEEHSNAINGSKYKYQIENIWNKMFRPRHKHGYIDSEINKIVDSPEGQKLMEYLERLYGEITND